MGALIGFSMCGGLGHIVLAESYRWGARFAPAPFDYRSMLWALILGLSRASDPGVFLGARIIVASGLSVIGRERRLVLERVKTP
jgi:hypothetical protein